MIQMLQGVYVHFLMSLHSLSQCLFHGCLFLGDRLHNKYRHDAPSGFSIEELLIISKAQSIKLSHSSLQTIQTGPKPPNIHTCTAFSHPVPAAVSSWLPPQGQQSSKILQNHAPERSFFIKTQLRACSIKRND